MCNLFVVFGAALIAKQINPNMPISDWAVIIFMFLMAGILDMLMTAKLTP